MKNIMDLKCNGCGGRIIHDPINEIFKCIACGNTYKIEDIMQADNDINDEEIEKYKCSNCGAEITLDGLNVSTQCAYCGNTAIVRSRLSNEYKPDYIVLFKTTKDQIEKGFNDLLKIQNEIGKDFIKNKKVISVKPIYIPFFLYSFGLTTTVKEYINDGHRMRFARVDLDDVPIDGSIKLDDDTMMNLFPYDMSKMITYNHAYLSGHQAEMYDSPKEEVSKKVELLAKQTVMDYFKDNSINSNNIFFENFFMTKQIIKYILLPVWMIDVEYKGKKYNFYMNGQTGEIVGKVKKVTNVTILLSILYTISLILIIYFNSDMLMRVIFCFLATFVYFMSLEMFNKKIVRDVYNFNAFKDKTIVREEFR